MGEASSPAQERILAILPFPEPTDLIAKIEKKHPNVKFIYRTLNFVPGSRPLVQSEVDKNCNYTQAPRNAPC